MPITDKLYYATCRKNARLTQEEAIYRLNIADTTTLSKYENGHVVPDQSIVAKMIQVYGVPSLAQWHVQHTNPDLAPWLAEVTILKTDGDVYLQADMATRIIGIQMSELRKVLDEDVGIDVSDRTPHIRNGFKRAASKALSIVAYIDDNSNKPDTA